MPLHLKYRPKTLDEFIGDRNLIESLESLFKKNPPHTFLFSGPSGCGKTTLARICSSMLKCKDPVEYNSSDTRGIDTARDIAHSSKFKPVFGNNKVFILDEVHQATSDFQHAILKVLEDTPSHCYFFLCTTDPEKLLTTIKNRCSIFSVQKLPSNRLSALVKQVAEAEGIDDLDEGLIDDIVITAEGSPRQALILLEQVIGVPPKRRERALREAQVGQKQVIDLCRKLNDKKGNWKDICTIIKNLDCEPEQARRAVLGYFSSILMSGDNPGAAYVLECFSQPYFNTGKAGLVLSCYESFFRK